MPAFNNNVKQLLILALLLGLIYLVLKELRIFFPGFLGALTLYILSRGSYYQLVYHYKWKKSLAAALFLVGYTAILTLLVYIIIVLLRAKVDRFLDDPDLFIVSAKDAIKEFQYKTGFDFFTESSANDMLNRLSNIIPALINNTVDMVANLALLLFLLYFMLVNGKETEKWLGHVIPLNEGNINMLTSETKRLVRASAIGIPVISLIQGLTATLGYYIFGVDDFILWGFLTGIFAFFPFVGTLLVWVPIVIFMYAGSDSWNATGLLIYSLIVTGNIDYVARITLLKKFGHVHPIVTILGVIVGLSLFGFIGFIFGPLLISYIILLFRIYSNEFLHHKSDVDEAVVKT
jgi:predicted PurR-regulated permease PerM